MGAFDVINVELRSEEGEPMPLRILVALAEIGKLPHYVDAILEGRGAWHTMCLLEDDLLAFESRNRWCGAIGGWQFIIGHCAELEDVPSYNPWGHVQAWLENWGWVFTFNTRDGQDGRDVTVWPRDEFYDHTEAVPIASADFADDSAIVLNRAMREIRELESLLERP
jgi:hypothetical protein